MSQLTLTWQEEGRARSQSFDLAQPVTKVPGAIRFGRDSEQCDVVLKDASVSRLHAEMSWSPTGWTIRNLRNGNPIMVNGQWLTAGQHPIQAGTLMLMGNTTLQVTQLGVSSISPPTFVHGNQTIVPPAQPQQTVPIVPPSFPPSIVPVASPGTQPPQVPRTPVSSVTLGHYLPLAGTGKELRQQGFLWPGIITVLWVVLSFAALGRPSLFNVLLAVYLGVAGFYLIYKLCGKRKPWWALFTTVLTTPLLLATPVWFVIAFFFRNILPGQVPPPTAGFIQQFIAFFFAAGLAEELLKALPIFAIAWFGSPQNSPARRTFSVVDPLDGIIFGAASGLGFTLLETLGQYVPDAVVSVAQQGGDIGTAQLVGLQLLLPRIVGSVIGHMAYSGTFGYYIGLSQLKPKRRWQFLGIGYLLSSVVHAFWNASSALGVWATAIAGLLTYLLLIGAILKGRQLSPAHSSSDR
jgi:RsiW-degrading membrane proteinase PrsW (M82 family)